MINGVQVPTPLSKGGVAPCACIIGVGGLGIRTHGPDVLILLSRESIHTKPPPRG